MANKKAEENGQVEEAETMEDAEIEKKIEESAELEEAKKEEKKKAEVEEEEHEDEEEAEESKKTSKKENKKSKKVEEEEEEEEAEEESKKEEIEVNVDEDVAALVDGEELSEEFKTKAATIFEAAVKSKIAKIRKQIREENKKEQDERIASMQEEMTDNMDKYLSYATKEWMEENKLSVETGVRNEVT